jgi:hypothetical protein
MHSGLKNTLQASLIRIRRGPKLLDKSNLEIIDNRDTDSIDDKSGHEDLLETVMTRWITRIDPELPWFRKLPNGQFITPQEPIFGYYALRNILRGLFLGASFLPAGDILLTKGFLSASIAMYYTASFHLISAYLALEGKVVITPVFGPPYITLDRTHESSGHKPIPGNPSAICAILTTNCRWIFEGRTRTHRAYWAELDRTVLHTRSIPECFINFARYLTSYGPYEKKYDNEVEMVRDALPYLQDARHEAIYQGYGYDPMSDDLLTNRDADYAPLDLRAKEYQDFSYGLLDHIVSETRNLVVHLSNQCAVALNYQKLHLTASIITPPFELRRDIADLLMSGKCNKRDFSQLVKEFLLSELEREA